jgi:hypothetical protein
MPKTAGARYQMGSRTTKTSVIAEPDQAEPAYAAWLTKYGP